MLIKSLLSVDKPAYVIPSAAAGLMVSSAVPSGAVLTKVTVLPIAIDGSVNTLSTSLLVKVLPESVVIITV